MSICLIGNLHSLVACREISDMSTKKYWNFLTKIKFEVDIAYYKIAMLFYRSATYYARERLCKLSPETRRTQPQHFRRAALDVDYMENECAQRKCVFPFYT